MGRQWKNSNLNDLKSWIRFLIMLISHLEMVRACIGMQFALHEATLVMGMLLQHFEFIDYEDYQLDVKQTLTLKPGDFKIRVVPRNQTISHTTVLAPTEEKLKTMKPSSKFRRLLPLLEPIIFHSCSVWLGYRGSRRYCKRTSRYS